jgi:hypothetical protein
MEIILRSACWQGAACQDRIHQRIEIKNDELPDSGK